MVRVWFNHWFSTSYRLIELMKQDNEEEIYVIASNKQIDSVIQKVCDEWYQDSLADGEEYLQYCIDFCREHKIDVFVPRRKMVEISQNRDRFTDIGVKVMVDDYEVIKLLNDKVATYDYLRDCEGLNIPAYRMVNTADEFEAAYAELKKDFDQVCPCNIQFRLKDGVPYLLEINTRMSGGLQMTCEAENINIPNIALNKVLGKHIKWSYEPTEKVVSYIEIPKIIR